MASGERKEGSDRGRPAIDWEQAFAFYASLPPERRSYATVATEFAVSPRTVETHGRRDRWRQRAGRIEAEAAAEVAKRLGHARADQLADVQKLIEASFITYAQQLRSGEVRLTASDLPRLVKLLHELWGAPSTLDEQPAVQRRSPPARPSIEHMGEVIAALQESGALTAFEQPTNHNQEEASGTSDS